MTTFKSFVLTETEEGLTPAYQTLTTEDLSEGDVIVRVHYSSINYKDMLAAQPHNKIIRQYPRIPGIDFSGTVIDSQHPRFQKGDQVLATGYDIGVAHDGGFSEVARVKGDWLVLLPDGLTLEEAMIIGTAGYTAALSVNALEQNGSTPEKGPILVRGASGGVGSMAIMMLQRRGYEIVASSGNKTYVDTLKMLGANQIISRIDDVTPKALHKTEWQGAIDPVGGVSLAEVLKRVHPSGAVAVSGNASGATFDGSVFPFILRGVRLIGIDSVYTPMSDRQEIWHRLSTDLKPKNLHEIKHVVPFDKIPEAVASFKESTHYGRIVIDMGASNE